MDEVASFNVAISTELGLITIRSANVKQLYFIEDMFSFTMSGKLIFNDSRGIFEYGPITGNETIHIEYGMGKEAKTMVFNIHKISRIRQITEGGTSIINQMEIIFVSGLFGALNYLKFCKSGKDKKIDKIVDDICKDMAPVGSWGPKEKTNEKLDFFYMPYGTPTTALKGLMRRATGSSSDSAGFLFYERTNPGGSGQQSCFETLEKVLSSGRMLTGIGGDDVYVHESASGAYINKILNGDFSGLDRFASKGLGGYSIIGFNHDKKKFKEEELKFSDLIGKQTLLGDKPLYDDISEPRTKHVSVIMDTKGNEKEKMTPMYENDWQHLYALQQTVHFEVMGHQNRYCGSMIKVDWGSNDPEPSKLYRRLSGKYLVKSIVHYFDSALFPPFRQKLICIKNSR